MNRFLSCLRDPAGSEWHPPNGESVGVGRFLASAMEIVSHRLHDQQLCFIFTANNGEIPMVGPEVIVFAMNEEHSLVPYYASKVGSVFKCYGGFPFLGPKFLAQRPLLATLTALRNAHVVRRWVHSAIRSKYASLASGGGLKSKTLHHLPLGYHSLPTKYVSPFSSRQWDVFFAGSTQHAVTRSHRARSSLPTPKEIARRELLDALRRLEEVSAGIRVCVKSSVGFVPNSVAWGFTDPATVLSEPAYMQELGNAKICVAPRGTSFETFRHYEGASMGCVVISEALPLTAFYEAAPFIRIRNWSEIVGIIPSLLADSDRMSQIHRDTLAWWERFCSPRAVADLIIKGLRNDGVLPSAASFG
jgi:hypothetical protein